MHIDADMLVLKNSIESISELIKISEIGLVQHPGYWRSTMGKKSFFYFKNYKLLFKDALLFCKFGALGTWSKDKKSQAYVKRCKRKMYFCGGIWFGGVEVFKNFIEDLNSSVEIDRSKDIVPVWHDESYLNKWATNNKFKILSPIFCYAMNYSHLKELRPVVLAVEKNAKK
jgi:hypothetical protein